MQSQIRNLKLVLTAKEERPGFTGPGLRDFLFELANCRDEKLNWLQRKYEPYLDDYTLTQLAEHRNELRLLWRSSQQIDPGDEAKKLFVYRCWLRVRASATLEEVICNQWLQRAGGGLLIVWEKGNREVWPDPHSLPGILAFGCLMFGDHLAHCANEKCGAPYFIGTRINQRYCSNECAWPAKRAAKLKWWNRNRSKSAVLLQARKRRQR